MSGNVDFATRSALSDWPLDEETGVGGMEEGFCTDEALTFGIAETIEQVPGD